VKPIYTTAARSSGRDGRAVTSDGRLDLQLAMPKEMGGTGEGTNPEQLFAAGYAACFATSMKLVARRMGLDASDVAVTAEVSLVPKGQGYALAAVLHVELPEHLKGETGRNLMDATHQVCPYSNATRGNIPVEVIAE
jgi:osmotically inducible protein OsmC